MKKSLLISNTNDVLFYSDNTFRSVSFAVDYRIKPELITHTHALSTSSFNDKHSHLRGILKLVILLSVTVLPFQQKTIRATHRHTYQLLLVGRPLTLCCVLFTKLKPHVPLSTIAQKGKRAIRILVFFGFWSFVPKLITLH